jgi:KDO2-lipid IV(A) lauroyltransferase
MAKKKPYRFLLYLVYRIGAFLVYLLPRSLAIGLARWTGKLAYVIVARQRNKALENLRFAFGQEKSEAEIRVLARRVFEHLAMTAAEVLQFPKLSREKINRLVDAEKAFQTYNTLLREGKGLISVTAHIGNWELLAGIFGANGYPGAVLARRIYYEPLNDWIVSLRQAVGVPTIDRDRSGREILKRLRANEVIGLLPDQDIASVKGIFVDFLGRPAYTPVAPVRLALASGAPLLPNFLIWGEGGRYRLILGEAIRPKITTTQEEAVREYTEKWMKSFEKVIREYPDQWAWMHPRWKSQPEAEMEREVGLWMREEGEFQWS